MKCAIDEVAEGGEGYEVSGRVENVEEDKRRASFVCRLEALAGSDNASSRRCGLSGITTGSTGKHAHLVFEATMGTMCGGGTVDTQASAVLQQLESHSPSLQ